MSMVRSWRIRDPEDIPGLIEAPVRGSVRDCGWNKTGPGFLQQPRGRSIREGLLLRATGGCYDRVFVRLKEGLSFLFRSSILSSMKAASARKYIWILVAGSNLLVGAMGMGAHFHLRLSDKHEQDRVHQHLAEVHVHEEDFNAPCESWHRQSDLQHGHHFPTLQIIAVLPVPNQSVHFTVAPLEGWAVSAVGCALHAEAIQRYEFGKPSPSTASPHFEDISGRSPPHA